MSSPGVTLNGKIRDISGNLISGTVTATLGNYGINPPVIIGDSELAPILVSTTANGSGVWSLTLWGSDQISPINTTYTIAITPANSNVAIWIADYLINSGTYDLSNLIPLISSPPIYIQPGGGGSGNISGGISATEIAFGSGTNSISGDSELSWNSTTHKLNVGVPESSLDPYIQGYSGSNVVTQETACVDNVNGCIANFALAQSSNSSATLFYGAALTTGNGSAGAGFFDAIAVNSMGETASRVQGLQGYAINNGAGTATDVWGTEGAVDLYTSSTATNSIGLKSTFVNHGGTLGTGYGVKVDGFGGVASANGYGVYIGDMGNASTDYALFVVGGKSKLDILIISTHTPSSASDTGIAGQISWDSSFIYVCVATNTWKRVAISTW